MSKKEGTSELEAGDETKKLEIIGNAKEKGNEQLLVKTKKKLVALTFPFFF